LEAKVAVDLARIELMALKRLLQGGHVQAF
jgi:hypothetical protein